MQTNVGSPQGDSISGTFFNIELETALRILRGKLNSRVTHIEHSYTKRSKIPAELEYADDTDFIYEDKEVGTYLKSIVKKTLGERNLKVNEDKTEETYINREKEKGDEEWRKTKKLGSLLCDYEDMKRRVQLANFAMSKAKVLFRKSKANSLRKVKIYKTLVKTVLTYNYSTWGLTKGETEEYNRCHRKILRRISPNYWNLDNKELYKLCNEQEIEKDMLKARWRTFGHILRLPSEAPCQRAMDWYFETHGNNVKYRGNKRTTLPIVLDNDIRTTNKFSCIEIKQFKTKEDLKKLRCVAADRKKWKDITAEICKVA